MITYKCNNDNKILIENITNIDKFSNILEIISINEINYSTESSILNDIKDYENYAISNDFKDLKCPLCKHDNVLHYHKEYQRNITFNIDNYEVNAKISITVLECSYCKNNTDKQHFHALLPIFIFPYHIYSESFILDVLNDRLINNKKIEEIIETRKISHQLFYKWLRGLKKYSVSASTILEIKAEITDIIKYIKKDPYLFLFQFFDNYYHPFFLFRLTCVPLVINP